MNIYFARVKSHPRVFAYATVLVAFFLRAYRLADKNVWWDEGWSIWLSQKDWAWIALRTAADEHPPLHYWLLHFWNFIAGTDAFAGRFVSLFFGVLTIALLYRIGKHIGTAWIGVLAALVLAMARFHIWWSQDIKNYTPSIFFAFAAVWFMLLVISTSRNDISRERSDREIPPFKPKNEISRSARNDKRAFREVLVIASDEGAKQSPLRHLEIASPHAKRSTPLRQAPLRSGPRLAMTIVGYALCAALAMWTHYLAALVLIALNLYALIVLIRTYHASRTTFYVLLRNWFIANILAIFLFAPWMYLYLQNAAAWAAAPTFDFGLFLKLVATVLPLGVTTNIDNDAALTVAFTAIAAIPAFSILFSREAFSKRKTEQWIVNALHYSLFTLMVLLPPALIYLLSLTPVSFFAPKIQARYLLILSPAYAMLIALGIAFLSRLSRYFAVFATLFVIGASVFVLNDYYAERRLTDEYTTLANTINSFAREGDIVLLDTDQEWPTFLYYLRAPLDWIGAPNSKPMDDDAADLLVRRALNRNSSVWLVTIPDALATDPQRLLENRLARELNKQYERTVGDKRLTLYSPTQRDFVAIARENFAPQYPRSDQIDMNTQLVGFDLPTRELNAGDTLRLVTYWHAAYPAMVSVRLSGLITTTLQVPSGDLLRYETDFAIPPNASGDFVVMLNQIELTRVNIEPRKTLLSAGTISHPTDYRFGDSIRLIGYDLPLATFHAGDTLRLNLYWRTDHAIENSYTAFVHILGEQWNPVSNSPLWGQVDRAPYPPPTAWLANEIVSDSYVVPIDPNAPPGKYKIEIGLYAATTGTRLPTDSGDSVTVTEIEIAP